MTQRILAATDLSAPSRHAVDRAYRLAAERNWPLTLLHAIPAGLFDSIQALLSMDSPSLDQSLEMDALSHMLFPDLFSLSPLSTAHPLTFQR